MGIKSHTIFLVNTSLTTRYLYLIGSKPDQFGSLENLFFLICRRASSEAIPYIPASFDLIGQMRPLSLPFLPFPIAMTDRATSYSLLLDRPVGQLSKGGHKKPFWLSSSLSKELQRERTYEMRRLFSSCNILATSERTFAKSYPAMQSRVHHRSCSPPG